MTKIRRSMRMEPILSTRCDAQASEQQMTFSEWVRTILRREVGLQKKGRPT
jgi:hypothetical protein